MTRARMAFAVSGIAVGSIITDLETRGLAAEMAGFTCAEAATANVTPRIKAANIEFFIFLPNCSNHRFLAGVGHLARRNHAPVRVNAQTSRFLRFGKGILLTEFGKTFRATSSLVGTRLWQAGSWKQIGPAAGQTFVDKILNCIRTFALQAFFYDRSR